jgi:hypothetical protein
MSPPKEEEKEELKEITQPDATIEEIPNNEDDELTSVNPQQETIPSPASLAKQQILRRNQQKSTDFHIEGSRGKPQSVKSLNSQS